MMKEQLCTTVGMVGGFIAALLGGWDTGLQTLMILIGIVTGFFGGKSCAAALPARPTPPSANSAAFNRLRLCMAVSPCGAGPTVDEEGGMARMPQREEGEGPSPQPARPGTTA